MDALELLLSRDSAIKLEAPGPSAEEIDLMLEVAVRAPDHGRLRPWRFVIVPTDKREAFGELLAASVQRREPDMSPQMLQRERDKALRAPIIVAVAAHLRKGHKIPEIEQISATAAAAQNIMLAAHAQGYGAMWKTGAPAYDDGVKRQLGFTDEDEIVGFLYLGTRLGNKPPAPRPPMREFISVWRG
jgi:nitroreductase